MKSYNYLLNNTATRRDELVSALVSGNPLPVTNSAILRKNNLKSATLIEIFEARDFDNIDHIMNLQTKQFGPINEDLFWLVVHYSNDIKENNGNVTIKNLLIPSRKVFKQWNQYHEEYFAGFIAKANELIVHNRGSYTNKELRRIIDGLLQFTANDKNGWTVNNYYATNLISVAKKKKRILVGPEKIKLSKKRLIGLLLHEIAIHVEWAEHPNHRQSIGGEEAVGTLVEQLSLSSYHPLRLYRFMAICFAVGVDGTPRAMRETYNKVFELRRILKPKESKSTSERYVAKEVVRVFRNLPPDKPGLVYIRDKQYFEHNIELWSSLMKQTPGIEAYELIVKPWKEHL